VACLTILSGEIVEVLGGTPRYYLASVSVVVEDFRESAGCAVGRRAIETRFAVRVAVKALEVPVNVVEIWVLSLKAE